MKRVAVVYRSHTGNTRRLAEEIGAFLGSHGVDATVSSIADCDPASLPGYDFVLFGCWTSGIFVVLQHPDRPFVDFARDVPAMPDVPVAFFTTYMLATGSMFSKMREALAGKIGAIQLEIKSRDGRLTAQQKQSLVRFVAAV